MPTVAVDKAQLYRALGREYSRDEFDALCFDYGIELDEDTSESKRPIVDGVEEPAQLKIEIPANRYDMLCFEGIAMNLRIFLGRQPMPTYALAPPQPVMTAVVHPDTARVRPYFCAAVLRGVTFTPERYDSFIALQDKLHQNLARQRTLVAIGTHDLDTIEGPFSYEARPPDDIAFAPLNQTTVMTAAEMMRFYEKDKHLSRYLPIIRDSPVYPIIYDKHRRVLSMPPIINSNHSKITLSTRNVFIDITATDKTKIEIVAQIIVAMFSQYCAVPFTVEPVRILSDHNAETRIAPDLSPRRARASASYINSVLGLELPREDLCALLQKMCHTAVPSPTDPDALDVAIPITRADVLHEADLMEDAAVGYGFNRLPRRFPTKSSSVAAALPINKLADIVRAECAIAGWAEVMPLILCSHDENYAWLNHPSDMGRCVRLANPKTAEYQIVRTSLVPGLLKTLRENRGHRVPMRIFEVGDVCWQDARAERRSRNERHFAAAWYGKNSGFEQVHGLLDRVMLMLRAAFVSREEGLGDEKGGKVDGYWIEEVEDPMYLSGHSAAVFLRLCGPHNSNAPAQRIGTFGILHPTVLKHFELPFPTSTLEIDLEPFL